MRDFPTEAVHFVKRLRGSSQSFLTRCSNSRFYAVKFTNNPNGLCALMNEVVTARLGRFLSLPLADYAFVYVSDWLLQHNPELVMVCNGRNIKYDAGIHFGSETPYHLNHKRWGIGYLPPAHVAEISDPAAFAGVLALDLWTGRSGRRKILFTHSSDSVHYDPLFFGNRQNLDNIGSGAAPPVPPVCTETSYYQFVRGWGSFEPWLTRIEELDRTAVHEAVSFFPDEWRVPQKWRSKVIRYLLGRRKKVRSAISRLRASDPKLFSSWGKPVQTEAGPYSSCSLAGWGELAWLNQRSAAVT